MDSQDTRSEADKAFGDWLKNPDVSRKYFRGMNLDVKGARTEFDGIYGEEQKLAAKRTKDASSNADYLKYVEQALKTPGRKATVLTDEISFTPNASFNPTSVL